MTLLTIALTVLALYGAGVLVAALIFARLSRDVVELTLGLGMAAAWPITLIAYFDEKLRRKRGVG